MDDRKANFNVDGAKRIVTAVRRIEDVPQTHNAGGAAALKGLNRFRAMIDGSKIDPSNSKRYLYGFKQAKLGTDGTWSKITTGGISGSKDADTFALNDQEGQTPVTQAVSDNTCVWISVEFEDDGTPQFTFSNGATVAVAGFWAQLSSGSLVSGENARWTYPFIEVTGQWTTSGKPQALTGGRSGSAFNSVEGNNATSGIGTLSGGVVVSSDDFSNGIKLQPISSGTVVWIRSDSTCNTGSGSGSGSGSGLSAPIYIFEGYNVKAECPS